MNPIKKSSLIILAGFVAALCSCSQSSSTPTEKKAEQSQGLTGIYSGKNNLGFAYQIEFISPTDCLITDPRRGHGPATYKVVGSHVLLSMPGGGGADINLQGDTLYFNDGGYPVSLQKQ